jgi:amidohydrolase
LLDEVGGAVSVFGTPAEEKGSGKIAFCDAGLFDDVDVGMICHAHAHPKKGWISGYTLLAVNSLTFEFHGEPAHAASDPYNGVNALDALVQTYNSVSTLRQQLKEDIRIHGVIEEGGLIPNIIPDYTRGVFWVRAPNTRELDEATDKVINCAKGAALATGTKLDVQRVSLEKDFLVNKPLLLLFEKNCHLLDLDFLIKSELIRGSSDVGNVSYICPTLSFEFPLSDKPEGIKVHSQEFAEAAVGETAHKNMILSAKLMALIAVDVLTDLDIAKAARRELDEKQRIRETRDK